MTNAILEVLQRVVIFNGIPVHLLANLAGKLSIDTYSNGTTVINKGDDGDAMFVLVKGKVKIHDGEHTVATMESGNFFGEFTLLDEAPRSMSVTATEDIDLLKISRELFFELLQSEPEVAKKVIGGLTKRLRGQTEAIIRQLKSREAELTHLVNERTHELKLSNEEISIKNKEITDNVNYAKRIQMAILPTDTAISAAFKNYFVLYKPKDIVSGDFYSFFQREKTSIIIAADCTGHGVTGAFLSVVGNSLLTQIINEKKIIDPGEILDNLHEAIIDTLNQKSGESTDGMDIAICSFDMKDNVLLYAGANRPLWIIRDNELIETKPNKYPIGGLQIVHEEKFTSHRVELQKSDTVYIFSDGYADQFGGNDGKKFMTKKLKQTLLDINSSPMPEQKWLLESAFDEWRGNHEQVDDVLVIGIMI